MRYINVRSKADEMASLRV